MEEESPVIDDSLYSRQRYVLGDTAMQQMAHSNVFLSGLGGLGVEIAKNIVLAGVKSITLHDIATASLQDLGSQFYLREEDVSNMRNRAEACVSRIAELNPYVTVKSSASAINKDDLSFLTEYQCVILTDSPLSIQCKVNTFCRAQDPPINFISASVFGVFTALFCDFGDQFKVVDPNGEDPKQFFVGKITKSNPGEVTTLENSMHGLQSGDVVLFKEVQGMDALNQSKQEIKVLSPYAFTICDTSGDEYEPYEYGGICLQVKPLETCIQFESLMIQLECPDILIADLGKCEVPAQLHWGFQALHVFWEQYGRLPEVRCAADAEKIIAIASSLNEKGTKNKVARVDQSLLQNLSYSCRGYFAPLGAALGGIVAQEALTSLTGKFSPIKQWLYLDAEEVLTRQTNIQISSFLPRQDRYDALRICIGDDVCSLLAHTRLFMVGCGAIGCEMLKNLAMLGVATSKEGLVTITDNDLIEKSNLNRQFLFRQHHIQKPKSTVAAESMSDINPAMNIKNHLNKVCPETEEEVYNDLFFEDQNLVINALDNVEARRYVDSRCVSNQRALIESGTMGPKGHVQVIIPHLTESYASQRDPPDEEVPYCTLKSFPATIEHTVQWARDKFESSFTQKPRLFDQFWATHSSPTQVLQCLEEGTEPENVAQAVRMLKDRPSSWRDCVAIARCKFEKYFNHKAKTLLHAFPLETRMKDGSLFWQSPKRPPTPQQFDLSSPLHMLFLVSTSRLYADIYNIRYTQQDLDKIRMIELLGEIEVPQYTASNKRIETDEKASKPDVTVLSRDDIELTKQRLKEVLTTMQSSTSSDYLNVTPLVFEKDDDTNGHIDFITAVSNLRAMMYNIEPADRLKIKRVAGKIVPAIATTTAAVAGLAAVELVKIVANAPLKDFKNCFMNLALPFVTFSEPAPAAAITLRQGLSITIWDKWVVHGHKNFKLKDFIQYFKDKYNFNVTMVVQGARMVYVPIMPGHFKRLEHKMLKLLKVPTGKAYVDLIVSFEGADEEDIPGPPVRYFTGKLTATQL